MIIEFYHIDAFEVANYAPIWRALKQMNIDARLVGVPDPHNRAQPGWFDFARFKAYCESANLTYTTKPDPRANLAMTTQNIDILNDYACPKIRIMYGPVIYPKAWGYQAAPAKPFSALLTHSEWYANHYAQWMRKEQLPVVGYPRFDDFFAGKLNRAQIRARWGVNDQRPVLAFLPTWGDNTAFEKFFPVLLALRNDYQILMRPHHCTVRFEPLRTQAMQASGCVLLDHAFDLAEVYQGADVILGDVRSGGLLEACMCEKPTVGMVINPNEATEWLGASEIPTIASVCYEPGQLAAAIKQALTSNTQVLQQKIWAAKHVAYRDGTAGQKAADTLIKLALQASKPVSKSGLAAFQGLTGISINQTNLRNN